MVLLDNWPMPDPGNGNNLCRGNLRLAGQRPATVRLTVPIHRRPRGQSVNQVHINGRDQWARRHWETVRRNYRSAPGFANAEAALLSIYSHEWQYLCRLNMTMIRWCQRQLEICSSKIILSSSLGLRPGAQDNAISIIGEALCANEYAAGFVERSRISEADLDVLHDRGLTVLGFRTEYRPYPQVGPSFIAELAVIDLILSLGSRRDIRSVLMGATEALEVGSSR